MSADPHLSDGFLAELSRHSQMGTPGPWTIAQDPTDSTAAVRIVAADTAAVLLECPLPADEEAARDVVYDAALAAVARTAAPLLLNEVVRLKGELAAAVASLNDLLRTIHGGEEHARRYAAELERQRIAATGGA